MCKPNCQHSSLPVSSKSKNNKGAADLFIFLAFVLLTVGYVSTVILGGLQSQSNKAELKQVLQSTRSLHMHTEETLK